MRAASAERAEIWYLIAAARRVTADEIELILPQQQQKRVLERKRVLLPSR